MTARDIRQEAGGRNARRKQAKGHLTLVAVDNVYLLADHSALCFAARLAHHNVDDVSDSETSSTASAWCIPDKRTQECTLSTFTARHGTIKQSIWQASHISLSRSTDPDSSSPTPSSPSWRTCCCCSCCPDDPTGATSSAPCAQEVCPQATPSPLSSMIDERWARPLRGSVSHAEAQCHDGSGETVRSLAMPDDVASVTLVRVTWVAHEDATDEHASTTTAFTAVVDGTGHRRNDLDALSSRAGDVTSATTRASVRGSEATARDQVALVDVFFCFACGCCAAAQFTLRAMDDAEPCATVKAAATSSSGLCLSRLRRARWLPLLRLLSLNMAGGSRAAPVPWAARATGMTDVDNLSHAQNGWRADKPKPHAEQRARMGHVSGGHASGGFASSGCVAVCYCPTWAPPPRSPRARRNCVRVALTRTRVDSSVVYLEWEYAAPSASTPSPSASSTLSSSRWLVWRAMGVLPLCLGGASEGESAARDCPPRVHVRAMQWLRGAWDYTGRHPLLAVLHTHRGHAGWDRVDSRTDVRAEDGCDGVFDAVAIARIDEVARDARVAGGRTCDRCMRGDGCRDALHYVCGNTHAWSGCRVIAGRVSHGPWQIHRVTLAHPTYLFTSSPPPPATTTTDHMRPAMLHPDKPATHDAAVATAAIVTTRLARGESANASARRNAPSVVTAPTARTHAPCRRGDGGMGALVGFFARPAATPYPASSLLRRRNCDSMRRAPVALPNDAHRATCDAAPAATTPAFPASSSSLAMPLSSDSFSQVWDGAAFVLYDTGGAVVRYVVGDLVECAVTQPSTRFDSDASDASSRADWSNSGEHVSHGHSCSPHTEAGEDDCVPSVHRIVACLSSGVVLVLQVRVTLSGVSVLGIARVLLVRHANDNARSACLGVFPPQGTDYAPPLPHCSDTRIPAMDSCSAYAALFGDRARRAQDDRDTCVVESVVLRVLSLALHGQDNATVGQIMMECVSSSSSMCTQHAASAPPAMHLAVAVYTLVPRDTHAPTDHPTRVVGFLSRVVYTAPTPLTPRWFCQRGADGANRGNMPLWCRSRCTRHMNQWTARMHELVRAVRMPDTSGAAELIVCAPDTTSAWVYGVLRCGRIVCWLDKSQASASVCGCVAVVSRLCTSAPAWVRVLLSHDAEMKSRGWAECAASASAAATSSLLPSLSNTSSSSLSDCDLSRSTHMGHVYDGLCGDAVARFLSANPQEVHMTVWTPPTYSFSTFRASSLRMAMAPSWLICAVSSYVLVIRAQTGRVEHAMRLTPHPLRLCQMTELTGQWTQSLCQTKCGSAAPSPNTPVAVAAPTCTDTAPSVHCHHVLLCGEGEDDTARDVCTTRACARKSVDPVRWDDRAWQICHSGGECTTQPMPLCGGYRCFLIELTQYALPGPPPRDTCADATRMNDDNKLGEGCGSCDGIDPSDTVIDASCRGKEAATWGVMARQCDTYSVTPRRSPRSAVSFTPSILVLPSVLHSRGSADVGITKDHANRNENDDAEESSDGASNSGALSETAVCWTLCVCEDELLAVPLRRSCQLSLPAFTSWQRWLCASDVCRALTPSRTLPCDAATERFVYAALLPPPPPPPSPPGCAAADAAWSSTLCEAVKQSVLLLVTWTTTTKTCACEMTSEGGTSSSRDDEKTRSALLLLHGSVHSSTSTGNLPCAIRGFIYPLQRDAIAEVHTTDNAAPSDDCVRHVGLTELVACHAASVRGEDEKTWVKEYRARDAAQREYRLTVDWSALPLPTPMRALSQRELGNWDLVDLTARTLDEAKSWLLLCCA